MYGNPSYKSMKSTTEKNYVVKKKGKKNGSKKTKKK